MFARIILVIFAVLSIGAACAEASGVFYIYPYDPMNAVAAEPDPPYNFDVIPKYSRTMVRVCPGGCPDSGMVPDIQPMTEAFRAKFGRRMPVP